MRSTQAHTAPWFPRGRIRNADASIVGCLGKHREHALQARREVVESDQGRSGTAVPLGLYMNRNLERN